MARSEISDNWVPVSREDVTDPRKREFIEKTLAKQKDSRKNNQMNNKGSIAYMSKPNVQRFNKAMENRIFNSTGVGRPYAFSSVEELNQEMSEYFDLCKETSTMPTVTSLALWLGVNRDTIYEHANNSNSPFSGSMKRTLTYLHSAMENGTLAGDINPVTYIFLSKNYFGMRDDKNITVTPTTNDSTINTQETMSAIQKQLEEENVANADYQEK